MFVKARHCGNQTRILLSATVAVLLASSIAGPGVLEADTTKYQQVRSIQLESPAMIQARVGAASYVAHDSLAVVRVPDAPVYHRVFTLNRNGDLTSDWARPPKELGWHPIAIAADVGRNRVYFSAGDRPLYVFDAIQNWIGTWFGMTEGSPLWPQALQVSPNGSVLALETGPLGRDDAKIHRWDSTGGYKGAWPSTQGQYHSFADIAVDEKERVLLSNMKKASGEPRSLIERFTERGAKIDSLDLDWPVSLGPPIPGHDPKITFLGLATDQARSDLLVFHSPQNSHSQHLLRYSSEGVFIDGYPLWRLVQNAHPIYVSAAAHPTDGFALTWTPHGRVDLVPRIDSGITQFDEHGRIRAITRMTEERTDTFPETWGRSRLAGATAPIVLYPRSGIIGAPLQDQTHLWTQTAPPFTMDIVMATDLSVVSRGWDGTTGRITMWNADRTFAWSKPCTCPLGTGLAIDKHRVYISDPTKRRVIAFRRLDGSGAGILAPDDMQVGWPVDIAADGENRLFTVDQSGRIAHWQWHENNPLLHQTWRGRSGHEPISISAGDGVVGMLFSSGTIEIWNQEGVIVDQWTVGVGASDVSIDEKGAVAILDSLGPSVQVYMPDEERAREVESGNEESGICTIVGDKIASPTRVLVGEEVSIGLTLSGSCPQGARMADVVLVWDPDSVFWYDYPYARTVEAMHQLLDALDVPAIQTAIVGLGSGTETASVLVDFALDRAVAHSVVSSTVRYDFAMRDNVWKGTTTWPDLVSASQDYLERAGRPGAVPVIILVGWQPLVPDAARTSAEQFRAEGGKLLALQFPEYYPPALQGLVASGGDIYHGTHAGDVAAVARRVGALLADGEIRDILVDDQLASEVGHVAGSTNPIAAETTRRLVWTLDEITSAQSKMSYRITADQVGRYATNREALAHYTDADGSRRTFRFPQPIIEVVAPTRTTVPATATATAQPSQTSLPTTTRVPVPIYLPLLLREKCSPDTRRVDMMLVLDASLSMLEPTASGSARTKLQAAKAAASVMVETLRLDSGDQIGIIAFNSVAHTLSPLTIQRSKLDLALASIATAPQTCIVCGLEAAIDELESVRGRPANNRVLVLLTDGRSSPRPISDAVAEASRGRAAGVLIYTVGLGADLEEDALRQIASSALHYRHAPNAEDLVQIYRDIAIELPCSPSSFWIGRF